MRVWLRLRRLWTTIRGAVGVDGDHIDVFLSNDIDGWNGRKVFVVDQYNPDGSFDEHKVMLGFNDADEAKSDYLANYENGWENGRRIDVTAVNLEDFEKWIASSKRKTKPFGEYSSVKNGVVPSEEGESVKRNEVLEYEKALDHMEDVEQQWGDKIQDYVNEHYPTQATTSAESTSEKGLQERKAMKADPVLKQMYAEAKKEIDAADEMVTQKYSALPEELRQQKADGKSAQPPTREESILRDVVIDHMQESGLDVLGTEDGQRVLDMANERGAKMSAKQKRALETATIADESTNNATVVSSADGAKVQNNLETLAEGYQNRPNKTKGFITDLSRGLGMEQHGASQYGTFETQNGKLVTIRVSNHNARVSFFDRNGEEDGISIVISSHKNKGVLNDGDAHIVEYFYPKQSLEKADGKPLSEIVRSVSEALNSGEFNDTTGLAQRQEVNADGIREHRVYHGSGAEFDHFDHSHMGEGEGAQAYGWGTYVTEVEGIGRTYAEQNPQIIEASESDRDDANREIAERTLARYGNVDCGFEVMYDGAGGFEVFAIPRDKEVLEQFKEYFKKHEDEFQSDYYVDDFDLDDANDREQFAQDVESSMRDYAEKVAHDYDENWGGIEQRVLYTVEIPDDNGNNYLAWAEPVSVEAINRITDYLREVYGDDVVNGRWLSNPLLSSNGVDASARTGAAIYHQLERVLGSDKKASLALAELGYAGIKYPAEYRRGGRDDGAKNYVIFNENDAKIKDHVRFFKTKEGEAYGFTVGGKIYIDPRIANAETPIHEYAPLWASALKANNAKEWKNVVDLMKGTKVWEEVKKTYPELNTDDEIADEVLATYSGRRGAERLREEMRKAAEEGDGVMGKAEAVSALQRVKRAIDKFWKAVADFLHIHYTSAEEVADRVMKDLLDGVDPRSMMDGGRSLRPETRVNVVEGKAEHGFKNYGEAKAWAKDHLVRTYNSEETGGKGDIRISKTAVDKYLSQSAVDKSDGKDVHLAVLRVLPEVIRESVDAEQHADFKKGENGVRSAENGVNPNVTIHRLYGAVRMDGMLYRVKVTLKEDKTSKEPKVPHSYEATKIELFAGTLPVGGIKLS